MYESIRFYRQINTPHMVATPVGVDAATAAWVAAVASNGGSVSAGQQTIVDNLIVSLKADGIWTLFDALWVQAAEDQPSALTDMKALLLATAVSAPTFTANLGYTGDGVADYIDTNFNPTTGTPNFTRDSASFHGWQTYTGTDTGAFMGAPSDNNRLYTRYSDGNNYARINMSSDQGNLSGGTGAGLWTVNRSGSNALQVYRNGSALTPGSAASVALTNEEFTLLQSAGAFCVGTMAAAAFGGSLDATQAGNFYTHMRTYMTAVGVP